jgi:hypothetical protein
MGRETKADFKRHYRDYAGKPDAIAKRSENNKARREMEKKVGKVAMKGKDVHHVKRQRAGGTNSPGNLKLMSPAKNRAWKNNSDKK